MQSGRGLCGSRAYLPGEQVGGETPLQERGWTRLVLLGREELKAESRVGVEERSIFVHAADDEQAAVEDANRRRVPALGYEVQILRIFKERAAVAGGRGAWFKKTESLVSRLNIWDPRKVARVAANTDLCK